MVELMVTVAILAILAAVAFPSFESSFRSNRVATATNELAASFALARSEALRNPGGAILCTSPNGTSCGGGWNDGWLVAADLDNSGTVTAADRVLRVVAARKRLALTAEAAGGSAESIRFNRRGRVDDGNARDIVLMPEACPAGDNLVREFHVAPTGLVSIAKGACT